MGASLQPILSLLNEIDNTNPKDLLTHVVLYSDESGRIQQEHETVCNFENLQQAENQLIELRNRLKKLDNGKN